MLKEITYEIKEVYEKLLKMQEEKEQQNSNNTVDFEKIYAVARKNALKDHLISEKDEHIQKLYCRFLASIINTTKNDELRYSQFVFLSRIIESIESPNFNTQDCLNYVLESGIDIPETLKSLDEEVINMLVVDSFIICKLNNETEKDNLEYVSECLSLFDIKKDRLSDLLVLSKNMFNEDDYETIKTKLIKIRNINIYLKTPFTCDIISDFNQIKNIKTDTVVIERYNFTNHKIDLDNLSPNNFIFVNCEFNKQSSVLSKEGIKNATFINCDFIDNFSDVKLNNNSRAIGAINNIVSGMMEKTAVYEFVYLTNANFINCKFTGNSINIKIKNECRLVNCEFKNNDTTYFDENQNMSILNCKFKEFKHIEIISNNLEITKTNFNGSKGDLFISSKKVSILDSEFENIENKFYRNYNDKYANLRSTLNISGQIKNCRFKNIFYNGPAIYYSALITDNQGKVSIENTLFEDININKEQTYLRGGFFSSSLGGSNICRFNLFNTIFLQNCNYEVSGNLANIKCVDCEFENTPDDYKNYIG